MASGDFTSVRAEIKLWERNFAKEHKRNPTVDDIRANIQIANKYRLYKKLTKSAAPTNAGNNRKSGSSTPPRKSERTSSVISKSRTIETTSALSSYNPFSPQKDKGKQRAAPNAVNSPPIPIPANPFATPTKTKPTPRIREPSPSPIPEAGPILPTTKQPDPPSAVTRARKRLRGEPVSPSPNKGKRRRVLSQRNISRQDDDSSSSDEEGDAGNSSFVADSPIKGSGSKSFMSLFEDASKDMKVKNALARTKYTSGIFGPVRSQSVAFEDDLESVLGSKPRKRPRAAVNGPALLSKLAPRMGTDNLYSKQESTLQPSHNETNEEPSSNGKQLGKRMHADAEGDDEQMDTKPSDSETRLIPPSPPRDVSSQRPSADVFSKGKGKASSRKKTKFDDDEDMDSLSDDVKVVPVSRTFRPPDDDYDVGPEFDPVYWFDRRGQDPKIHAEERVDSTFEVDLPDKLRHVLALSSSDTRLQDIQEERVVESLIYGRRTTHYEPSKGGEIWDVGDVAGPNVQEENVDEKSLVDEDWEGEPVPWEIGEL
ncbi:hypothetical protein EV360DRAFT_51806 [Lentinula raphanica]|nr:hypothetical protein EV360DRAFT_51806 [Lentinula raphanica]